VLVVGVIESDNQTGCRDAGQQVSAGNVQKSSGAKRQSVSL
jgi:hypothetical protein